MPKRGEMLDMAKAIVGGAREDEYGGPEDSFGLIGELWTVYLRAKAQRAPGGVLEAITPADVAIMMMLLKTARLTHSPDHLDSATDVAGYAACLAEITSGGPSDGSEG